MGQPSNTLHYGDNLDILRRYIDDESVDLIYLDPLCEEIEQSLNSNADYNVLFAASGSSRRVAALADQGVRGGDWDLEAAQE